MCQEHNCFSEKMNYVTVGPHFKSPVEKDLRMTAVLCACMMCIIIMSSALPFPAFG